MYGSLGLLRVRWWVLGVVVRDEGLPCDEVLPCDEGLPYDKGCPVDVVELVEEGSGWVLAILASAVELMEEDFG